MRISWYEGENFPEAWKGKLQINSCLKLQSYASRNMESIYSHVFSNVLNYTPPPLLANSGKSCFTELLEILEKCLPIYLLA